MKNYSKRKKRKQLILESIIFSLAFLLFSIMFNIFLYSELRKAERSFELEMCSSVGAIPSWANEVGKIIDSGYVNFTNYSNVVRDYLVPNHVYFLYNSECGWCKKQIEEFGEVQWLEYQNSELTIDCKEVLE